MSIFKNIKSFIASKLIEDAHLWHKMWSIRFAILTTIYTTAAGAWLTIPGDWKPVLTHREQVVLAIIGIVIPVLTGASRVIKQSSLDGPTIPKITTPPPLDKK